jgi:NTP-dependent ternary system trypsin peptidase co-occuring protein
VAQERVAILVEWPQESTGGSWQVSRSAGVMERFKEESEKAIETALATIQEMARRVAQTIDEIPDSLRPDKAEVEFGVNLHLESGALIAKASTEAQLNVRLSWSKTRTPAEAAARPA